MYEHKFWENVEAVPITVANVCAFTEKDFTGNRLKQTYKKAENTQKAHT